MIICNYIPHHSSTLDLVLCAGWSLTDSIRLFINPLYLIFYPIVFSPKVSNLLGNPSPRHRGGLNCFLLLKKLSFNTIVPIISWFSYYYSVCILLLLIAQYYLDLRCNLHRIISLMHSLCVLNTWTIKDLTDRLPVKSRIQLRYLNFYHSYSFFFSFFYSGFRSSSTLLEPEAHIIMSGFSGEDGVKRPNRIQGLFIYVFVVVKNINTSPPPPLLTQLGKFKKNT